MSSSPEIYTQEEQLIKNISQLDSSPTTGPESGGVGPFHPLAEYWPTS